MKPSTSWVCRRGRIRRRAISRPSTSDGRQWGGGRRRRRRKRPRARGTRPRLLLLDEVMAGLNPAEVDQAVALVGKLSSRGLTIVIVEHVMRAIMAVARHIVVVA